MGWLSDLGLNRQAKDCLATMKAFDADFDGEAAWPLLKKAATDMIRSNSKTIQSKMLRDGIASSEVTLTLAANLALQKIGSGEHHTYRGRLSIMGQSYRTVFSTIVSLQALQGTITHEERDQALINMHDAIQGAG